jgi:hypothetical protein
MRSTLRFAAMGAALSVTACAEWEQVGTPTESRSQAFRECYRVAHKDDPPAILAAFGVAGAISTALSDTSPTPEQKSDILKQCLLEKGWRQK